MQYAHFVTTFCAVFKQNAQLLPQKNAPSPFLNPTIPKKRAHQKKEFLHSVRGAVPHKPDFRPCLLLFFHFIADRQCPIYVKHLLLRYATQGITHIFQKSHNNILLLTPSFCKRRALRRHATQGLLHIITVWTEFSGRAFCVCILWESAA